MNRDSQFPTIPHPGRPTEDLLQYQSPCYTESDLTTYSPCPLTTVSNPVPNCQRRLTDERVKCDRNLGWSIDWATTFLVDHLDPKNSPGLGDTLRRIAVRASQLAREGLWKQVAYHAYQPLNNALFAGHLKDAVYLSFGRLGAEISGATFTHGGGPNRRVKRISIILNADVLHNNNGAFIVTALVHHMLHAYFLVACGPEKEKQAAYGRLDHGLPFSKVMNAIKVRAKTGGKNWLPGVELACRRAKLGAQSPYHWEAMAPSEEDWHSSRCPGKIELAADGDIEKWYNGVCEPLLEQPEPVRTGTVLTFKQNELKEVHRAETTPSADSVEFIFEDRGILVPSERLNPFLSIRKAFEDLGHRYMTVHEDVSKDALMALLELLHTGTYTPDLTPVISAGRSGPPIIRPTRASSPPYLARDISVFKLGVAMSFDDIIGLALSRLRSQLITHEDPITILEAIYNGGDPHPELRAWTRDFLCMSPGKDDEWSLLHHTSTSDTANEGPNLLKLKVDMSFSERFSELKERYCALQIDYYKAEECLLNQGKLGAGLNRPSSTSSSHGLRVGGNVMVTQPAYAYGAGTGGYTTMCGGGMGVGAGMPMRVLHTVAVPVPMQVPFFRGGYEDGGYAGLGLGYGEESGWEGGRGWF